MEKIDIANNYFNFMRNKPGHNYGWVIITKHENILVNIKLHLKYGKHKFK